MGEKLNLVLIIALFLLVAGLSYYFYSNLTIEKKTEKIIVENYKVMDFSGMMRLVAECPEKTSIIAGGCEGEAGWINVFSSKPIKRDGDLYNTDVWECSFSQNTADEVGLYAYAICE